MNSYEMCLLNAIVVPRKGRSIRLDSRAKKERARPAMAAPFLNLAISRSARLFHSFFEVGRESQVILDTGVNQVLCFHIRRHR